MSLLDKRTRDDPRRRATVHAFLRATRSLLEEGSPFAELTVRRIADRAGRTRTAFYAHFDDRRQLLFALLDEAGGEALTAVGPFLAGDGPVGRQEITASVRGLLAAFRDNAVLLRAVLEAAGYDDQVAVYWDDAVGRFVDVVRRRLQTEGLGEEQATATATALVWMNERTCYRQAVRGGTGLADEMIVAAVSGVWWAVLETARSAADPGDRRGLHRAAAPPG